MKRIFTLDSWQVFVFILVPIIFPGNIVGLILSLGYSILIACWAYYLGINLYSKLPGGHHLNLSKFKLFLLFPIIYLAIVMFFTNGGYSINNNNIDEYGPIAYVIIPLHFFIMFCVFYDMYFISKALVCVLTQDKNVAASDYIGYFFGFWFFPIGVWFIQPKIKKIFSVE